MGKGVGRYVMEWVDRTARNLNKACVFLYSMDSSDAVAFYEKTGYRKAATKRLPFEQMKPEYRGMYLMIKAV
jgi:predicted N-acetyltransferase YhbS